MAPRVSQAHSARNLTKCPTALPTERDEAELPDCVVETSVLASERKARMLGSERRTEFLQRAMQCQRHSALTPNYSYAAEVTHKIPNSAA